MCDCQGAQGTGDQTQGFMHTRQPLALNFIPSLLHFIWRVSMSCLGWPPTCYPHISTSPVAGITGEGHSARLCVTILRLKMGRKWYFFFLQRLPIFWLNLFYLNVYKFTLYWHMLLWSTGFVSILLHIPDQRQFHWHQVILLYVYLFVFSFCLF